MTLVLYLLAKFVVPLTTFLPNIGVHSILQEVSLNGHVKWMLQLPIHIKRGKQNMFFNVLPSSYFTPFYSEILETFHKEEAKFLFNSILN